MGHIVTHYSCHNKIFVVVLVWFVCFLSFWWEEGNEGIEQIRTDRKMNEAGVHDGKFTTDNRK